MIIALDYDGTYTADPALWDAFILAAKASGHTVLCVTMRHPSEAIEMPCEVVYTSRKAKVPFTARAGIRVNVWIDDSPHWLLENSA